MQEQSIPVTPLIFAQYPKPTEIVPTLVRYFVECPLDNPELCSLALKEGIIQCQICFAEAPETDPVDPQANFTNQ